MIKTTLFPILLALLPQLSIPAFAQNETFQMRQVACTLSQPWEITYGPDDHLWVTEANSYQVSRINPTDGTTHLLADLSSRRNFPSNLNPLPQGGLMGLALHPQLLTGKPFVYLAYVYRFDGCLPDTFGCYFRTKVVRFTYDIAGDSLSNEVILTDTLRGSNDHNGGRLVIGPVGNTMYLFYSIGDMGAGQFMNKKRTHNGQNPNVNEGKILRFNLEPDGDPIAADSWVPNDNPFATAGAQNAVWSLGHRNPQGLVFGPTGILYETEHGPYSDDELNIILPQRNYGFPLVVGFADGNYNGSAVGTGPTVPLIVNEQANAAALGPLYKDPLKTFFPASPATITTIFNNEKSGTPPFPNYYLSWPSSAPAGMEYYGSDAIPGWKNSLLIGTLKLGRVFRLQLSADGQSVVGDTIAYFHGLGRFRDLAISSDGKKIYVALDTMGALQGPPGVALTPPIRGCILEFAYATSTVGADPLEQAVQVYPNPANQTLRLDLTALPAGPVWIKTYNPLGVQIIDQQWDTLPTKALDMDIAGWPEGHYFMSIQSMGEGPAYRVVKKISVQRH